MTSDEIILENITLGKITTFYRDTEKKEIRVCIGAFGSIYIYCIKQNNGAIMFDIEDSRGGGKMRLRDEEYHELIEAVLTSKALLFDVVSKIQRMTT